MLKYFTHIFVQDENSFLILNSINIKHVTIVGDTRFDRVFEIAANAKIIAEAKEFSEGFKVVVVGSAWYKDEEILIPYINNAPQNVKFIIAPHEINEADLSKTEKRITIPTVRFSKAKESDLNISRVLLIDNVGMLSSLYRYGYIAYIGGGFGKGIHNILEATVYGLPVFFGPNYKKFSEAVSLISEKGAFSVNTSKEIEQQFNELFKNEEYYQRTSKISKTFVEAGKGATGRIIERIK